MASKDKDEQGRGKDRSASFQAGKESRHANKDDADGDEGELTAVKPKTGEPSDNLRRRAEWFQKRHGGG